MSYAMRGIRLNAIEQVTYLYHGAMASRNDPLSDRYYHTMVKVLNFCLEKEFKNGYNLRQSEIGYPDEGG
jgi:hypothetical protein